MAEGRLEPLPSGAVQALLGVVAVAHVTAHGVGGRLHGHQITGSLGVVDLQLVTFIACEVPENTQDRVLRPEPLALSLIPLLNANDTYDTLKYEPRDRVTKVLLAESQWCIRIDRS